MKEYEVFRKVQDKKYISDFDRLAKTVVKQGRK
jgi:hypothetical protein